MYDGIRAWDGIGNSGAAVPILYFMILVVVGNCILYYFITTCSQFVIVTMQYNAMPYRRALEFTAIQCTIKHCNVLLLCRKIQ